MVTLYTYNTLDNFTCVEQHGTATGQTGCSSSPSNDASSAWRIRRFTYDSLGHRVTASRMARVTMPFVSLALANISPFPDSSSFKITLTPTPGGR
jgi:hypothetical protein